MNTSNGKNLRASQSGSALKQCPICGKTCRGKQALTQHRIAMHSGPSGSGVRGRRSNPRSYPFGPAMDGTQRKSQVDLAEDRAHASSNLALGETTTTSRDFQELVSQVIGDTPDGRAWAFAALHPCGVSEITARNISGVVGMSDTMTGSVASPVYRGESTITFSPDTFRNDQGALIPGVTGAGTYGVDIICPPIPEIDYMYRLIDDASSIKSPWVVVRLPDYNLPALTSFSDGFTYVEDSTGVTMASSGYGKSRIIGRGHTFELDAAGLNDQGRIVAGQMEGQWFNVPLNIPSSTVQTDEFVKSVDPVTTGSAVTSVRNQGAANSTTLWFLSVPTDPSVITSNCPAAYQGLAKHGLYAVTKFTSPLLGYAFERTGSEQCYRIAQSVESGVTTPFMPQSAFAIKTGAGYTDNADLFTSDFFWTSASTDLNIKQSGFSNMGLYLNGEDASSNVSGASLHPFISAPSNMMTKVVTFRNLPAGSVNSLTSGIRVKSREYLEGISNGSNPAVAPYIHPPCSFDFQALNSVVVAGKKLADGYPASANSLSGILGKIWGALSSVVHPITRTLGDANIPGLSPFANIADNVLSIASPLASGLIGAIPF